MSEVSPENLLLVGKVLRPHGSEGRLRILSYAQSERSFLDAGTIILKSSSGETGEYPVSSVSPHKNVLLLKLKGVNSLKTAEKYRGAGIYLRKDSLVQGEDDDFFWYELIGLRVYLRTGEYIGTIRHIFATGSHDIYVVREREKEVFIPAIHHVIQDIDLANKRVIISHMEGLLDLNEV